MKRRAFLQHITTGAVIAPACVCDAAQGGTPGTLPVIERNGQSHVEARELAKAGIAAKELPGLNLVAVCYEERCATVKEFRREAQNLFVMIGPMAKALGMKSEFSPNRREVSFGIEPRTETITLPLRPGQLMPDFRVMSLDGKTAAFSTFRGRRVMLSNWATWCGSRNDLPVWDRVQQRLKDQQFDVFSVAADVQGPPMVRNYVSRQPVSFTVAVDQADVVGRLFGLKNSPFSAFIDEVGIIRFTAAGPHPETIQRMMELLKEPPLTLRSRPQELSAGMDRASLETRVAQKPEDWEARLALALELDKSGLRVESLAQVEQAARLQPKNAVVLQVWGLLHWNLREPQPALAKWKQARDLAPDNWRLQRNIWAVEFPDMFYKVRTPDLEWQRQQRARELKGA